MKLAIGYNFSKRPQGRDDPHSRKQRLTSWARAHKKELAAAGIGTAVIVAAIIGLRNTDIAIVERKPLLRKPIVNTSAALPSAASPKTPHGVSGHVRNLPEGWRASAAKAAEATANGYKLKPGQTWVVSYSTGKSAS